VSKRLAVRKGLRRRRSSSSLPPAIHNPGSTRVSVWFSSDRRKEFLLVQPQGGGQRGRGAARPRIELPNKMQALDILARSRWRGREVENTPACAIQSRSPHVWRLGPIARSAGLIGPGEASASWLSRALGRGSATRKLLTEAAARYRTVSLGDAVLDVLVEPLPHGTVVRAGGRSLALADAGSDAAEARAPTPTGGGLQ
jgi:hypothetical protein